MKKLYKIICLDFTSYELDPSYWSQIDHLCETKIFVSKSDLNDALLRDADGLLVKLGAKVDQLLLERMPRLRYIGMLGTGYGGVDTDAARKQGVVVTNIADYATEGVAEFTFGMLLGHIRDLEVARSRVKSGDYSDQGYRNTEIRGKTFGVIGLGNIGRRTAEIAQVFGAEVIYWSAHRKPDAEKRGIRYVEIDELLSRADILTVNLALNKQTEGFLNRQRLKSIKKNAIVINPSPMELVNFKALTGRLKRKELTFILDHSDEVPTEQMGVLGTFSKCIVYPPTAYMSEEASQLKKQIYVDNLANFLKGEPTNKVS